jgi:hypothetical protein
MMKETAMATQTQTESLLQRMRKMSAADLSVLQASADMPDSQMTTAPGSPNEALWSEMEKLGWMIRAAEDISLPGGGKFAMLTYSMTPAGREAVSKLLSLLLQE